MARRILGIDIGGTKLAVGQEVPVQSVVARAFDRPVFLANDADAAALGEYRFGAGQGFDSLLYVTISTGIGAGLVVGRRDYQGACG